MKIDVLTIAVIIFSLGVCVSAMDMEETLNYAQKQLPPVFQQLTADS